MKLLLDTNAYTALRRGDPAVADLVRAAESLVFSVVVAGELLHGFRNGSRYADNVRELESFLASEFVEWVDVTWRTAGRFGRLATSLRRAGTPIPTNDVWIAAHALETASDLLSFDKHFVTVPDLTLVNPKSKA